MNQIRCKICQSGKYKIIKDTLRHNIKRNVLRCGRCGFVYLEPKQEGGSVKYYSSRDYRKKYGPNLKKVATSQEIFDTYFPFQQKIFDEIKHIIKPKMKILDVGCSTGHFLAFLKGRVQERVGVELNKEEVNFIRKNLDFKVYSEPIESVSIKEGPFDLITSFRVIEHVDDPAMFLKSIAKQLKTDGYLYLELPNLLDVLLSCYKIPAYADFYYREPHVSYFSKETLSMLLKKTGFKGKVSTVQRYNFLNHMNWFYTGRPQGNFTIGHSDPILIDHNNMDVDVKVKRKLNDFIKKVDREYRQLLNEQYLGEALTFLGKKTRSGRSAAVKQFFYQTF